MLKVTSIITYYKLQKMQKQHGLLHNQLITTEVFLLQNLPLKNYLLKNIILKFMCSYKITQYLHRA